MFAFRIVFVSVRQRIYAGIMEEAARTIAPGEPFAPEPQVRVRDERRTLVCLLLFLEINVDRSRNNCRQAHEQR